MGINNFFSNSSFDDSSNPNPNNYNIISYVEKNNYLVIKINYLNCSNYEGNKILVFEDCKIDDLRKQKYIDPHFSDNKNYYSPVARFEPTENGWNYAMKLIK